MSRAADVAYRALHDALNEIDAPACTGDERFLMEDHQLAPEELAHLSASICRPCPIRTLCRDYGNAARPPAGVWAGRTYPKKERKHRMNTITPHRLAHADGCPSNRIDVTTHQPDPTIPLEQAVVTLHCLDCSAHEAFNEDGGVRPQPKHVGPLQGLLPVTEHAEPIDQRIRPYYTLGGN